MLTHKQDDGLLNSGGFPVLSRLDTVPLQQQPFPPSMQNFHMMPYQNFKPEEMMAAQ